VRADLGQIAQYTGYDLSIEGKCFHATTLSERMSITKRCN
jgi:hypothetical protein